MDEELAAKLQREEEEEWEREISARFGDHGVGWCFVEVPSSADCEYGVMSVVQQEISVEEHEVSDPNDPDYALTLELQAQEAEQYDRLRRQQASTKERIEVMQQDPPKRRQLRNFIPPSTNARSSRRQSSFHYSSSASSTDACSATADLYGFDSDNELDDHDHQWSSAFHSSSPTRLGATATEVDDDEDDYLEDELPLSRFGAMDITLRSADRKPGRSYRS
ncbi:hypothetical protein P43SY_010002 [Pythium insidiosum]|uniref:Uncharacterized protein n=1 Tax=Pythium insidiosum TaxID=114742 RepID=A0AAD5Q783_PYTIN|nr:hypothetical protein P43SY_010002 [Pythium insidiosum]